VNHPKAVFQVTIASLEGYLFMAVVLDLMHWSSTVYQNRTTIPGYTGA